MAWLFLIVVCGVATLCNLDSHLHGVADKMYLYGMPPKPRRYALSIYAELMRPWYKRYIESLKNLGRRIFASFKKNTAIFGAYVLFFTLLFLFSVFFYERLYPFIDKLYMAINAQIMGIDIGDDAFRNASLSIGGSITLSIALLGVILTVIRNILTRQQNKIDEERLVTEQISRAVDQIGADKQTADGKILGPNIEVRLGGLYSLQRIMKNSPEDVETIARIFYAYVRENLKRKQTGQPKQKVESKRKTYKLPEDIEAARSIINKFDKTIFPDSQLNFSRADFREYWLIGADFRRAILEYADFSNADLTNANLSHANLLGADLSGVDFTNANLSGAELMETDLSGAALMETDLSGANLSNLDLSEIDLLYANLDGANLWGVNLSGADLDEIDLSNVNLSHANLSRVDLNRAVLLNSNLSGANLSGANLSKVELEGADLSYANLSGARLRTAFLFGIDLSRVYNLTQEQINEALGDEYTKLPEGLIYPEHWIK